MNELMNVLGIISGIVLSSSNGLNVVWMCKDKEKGSLLQFVFVTTVLSICLSKATLEEYEETVKKAAEAWKIWADVG